MSSNCLTRDEIRYQWLGRHLFLQFFATDNNFRENKRIYSASWMTKGRRYPSEKPLDSTIGFPNTFPLDSYLSLVDSVIYPLNNRHLRTKFDLTDVISQNEENIYSRLQKQFWNINNISRAWIELFNWKLSSKLTLSVGSSHVLIMRKISNWDTA